MEVQGKIKKIDQTKEYGNNGFRKREMVITTEEQYPQFLSIEFVQDKCDLLDKFQIGDDVKIGINLRGREWINPEGEAKYFNSIQGWRIEKQQQNMPDNMPPPEDFPAHGSNFESAQNLDNQDENDDLPF